jgi:hypothetical protein
MPRWDYGCKTCARIVVNSENLIENCPNCCKEMERMPSAPNFVIGGKFTAKTGYSGR